MSDFAGGAASAAGVSKESDAAPTLITLGGAEHITSLRAGLSSGLEP